MKKKKKKKVDDSDANTREDDATTNGDDFYALNLNSVLDYVSQYPKVCAPDWRQGE